MAPTYNVVPYDAKAAVSYAHKWSFARNPSYLDFSELGGDCTNFVSQCLYAGSRIMNFTPVYGWYYQSASKRSASWTGAMFLHKFLTTQTGVGPFGVEVELDEIVPGDVIQLAKNDGHFYHSLLVVDVGVEPRFDNILIATHTYDADYRALSSYTFERASFIHIPGVRK